MNGSEQLQTVCSDPLGKNVCVVIPVSKCNTVCCVHASALCGCNKRRRLLPPFPVFSMRYWYMCSVNSMCEFRCSSSVVSGRWLLWRAAMAASRNQAAFSGVGARSSDWFWSWREYLKKMKLAEAVDCCHCGADNNEEAAKQEQGTRSIWGDGIAFTQTGSVQTPINLFTRRIICRRDRLANWNKTFF